MKRPMFKSRIGWAVDKGLFGKSWIASWRKISTATHRVRVIDARELTAEKAVALVLQRVLDVDLARKVNVKWYADSCGMTATVKNGEVIVQKARK